jgi:hypothetical protein
MDSHSPVSRSCRPSPLSRSSAVGPVTPFFRHSPPLA